MATPRKQEISIPLNGKEYKITMDYEKYFGVHGVLGDDSRYLDEMLTSQRLTLPMEVSHRMVKYLIGEQVEDFDNDWIAGGLGSHAAAVAPIVQIIASGLGNPEAKAEDGDQGNGQEG